MSLSFVVEFIKSWTVLLYSKRAHLLIQHCHLFILNGLFIFIFQISFIQIKVLFFSFFILHCKVILIIKWMTFRFWILIIVIVTYRVWLLWIIYFIDFINWNIWFHLLNLLCALFLTRYFLLLVAFRFRLLILLIHYHFFVRRYFLSIFKSFFMSFHMHFQSARSHKAALTNWTLKRSSICMFSSMICKMTLCCKFSSTSWEITSKWFFTCMNSHMCF